MAAPTSGESSPTGDGPTADRPPELALFLHQPPELARFLRRPPALARLLRSAHPGRLLAAAAGRRATSHPPKAPVPGAHMRFVATPDAPTPKGHYSQAVVHGGLVYVAGQLAKDPRRPDADPGDVATQTRTIFRNIASILAAAGSGLDRVLQATIYLADMGEWSTVNAVFAEAMGEHRPARAIVPIATLSPGRDIEVTVVAALNEESGG